MATEGVGFQPAGSARVFNVLHYALMDAELHYREGMVGRRKYGAPVPPDLDVEQVFRRKLQLLSTFPALPEVLARMDWVEAQMAAADGLLRRARPSSARGVRERQVLEAVVAFKRTRISTLRRLLAPRRGHPTGARAALRAELEARDALLAVYAEFLRPSEAQREISVLFDGELAALKGVRS